MKGDRAPWRFIFIKMYPPIYINRISCFIILDMPLMLHIVGKKERVKLSLRNCINIMEIDTIPRVNAYIIAWADYQMITSNFPRKSVVQILAYMQIQTKQSTRYTEGWMYNKFVSLFLWKKERGKEHRHTLIKTFTFCFLNS